MLISGFYSDPHFGHANIIQFCSRPFRNSKHMEQELIRLYNEHVSETDTILWCGDVCFGSNLKEILDQLNGFKILVRGNHDKAPARMAEAGFDLVLMECVLHIAGKTCRVSHFPYADMSHSNSSLDTARADKFKQLRPKRNKGEVLIHGHTHSKKRRQGNCIHVGVDAWEYRPASMAEVEALVQEV